MRPTETSPLAAPSGDAVPKPTLRFETWEFLEARTPWGYAYEVFTAILIVLNVVAFVFGTNFSEKYNVDSETGKYLGPSCSWCDEVFVGEHTSSGFSLLELLTAIVFTVDYMLRFWACLEDEEYPNRMSYVFSFFSVIDLASILPFYIDLMSSSDIPAMQFLRMFRLVRMMKVRGRFADAFCLFDDVFRNNRHLLLTASFVGSVVWMIAAGFFYIAERKNHQMIYCPKCPDVDVDTCTIDKWGFTDCSAAGCSHSCSNLYESIPSSIFFTVVNLFGEYPLADRHSGWGKVVGTLVAVCAVFVFAIPTGIIGNGFSDLLEEKRNNAAGQEAEPVADPSGGGGGGGGYGATGSADGVGQPQPAEQAEVGMRERIYGTVTSTGYEVFTGLLVVASTIAFMLQTCDFVEDDPKLDEQFDNFELATVIVFTIDYVLRFYSIPEDPKYAHPGGRLSYAMSFFALIDLFSVAPYWIGAAVTGSFGGGSSSVWLRALRLLRLMKAERYLQVFGVFGDVIRAQSDVLIVTGFVAGVFWVFFSAVMYYAERDNPDPEMAKWYRTIPASMWVTMLNLSGEVPLCFFTTFGKVIAVIMGVFAVGLVGIPIGILGAGFQDWIAEHAEDTPDAEQEEAPAEAGSGPVWDFVEGNKRSGELFNGLVLLLIFVTIGIAIIGTVPAYDCNTSAAAEVCETFEFIELLAALVFSFEYVLRFYAAPSKCRFFFSFYSLVDLLAIIPTFIALFDEGGWVDKNATTFLLLRVLRLFKLDKYAPSITLIDDVFRLKRTALFVAGAVAFTLWIIFATLLYLAESGDSSNEIDRIPEQGCKSGTCYQKDRFSSVPASLPFTMIHLTGDYPIIEYSWLGCCICGVMVVVGAGLVAIPSAIIADGFAQVVEEKSGGPGSAEGSYEVELRALRNTAAPREFNSDVLEHFQTDVNTFLNGRKEQDGSVSRTPMSRLFRNAILVMILVNVVGVIWESDPSARKDAESSSVNVFEAIEVTTVAFFTAEYIMRIFSVTKDKDHLYSRYFYMTTFFGIVDLLSILPFYIALILAAGGNLDDDLAAAFRMLRLFRLLELEHFVEAFTVLDNVFRRSSGVFMASGLMALAIWISSASLFYLFEKDNPNWCITWENPTCEDKYTSDCECKERMGFGTMPDSLFFVAVFLGGEWAVVDFTLPGKFLCMVLCLVGIAIYAVPVGTFFDSFGKVLEGGLEALDEEEGGGEAGEKEKTS